MNIILYSNGCPKCNILKSKLDEKNIKYEIFDDVQKMIDMGMSNMPILSIGGLRMVFSDAMKYLEENN